MRLRSQASEIIHPFDPVLVVSSQFMFQLVLRPVHALSGCPESLPERLLGRGYYASIGVIRNHNDIERKNCLSAYFINTEMYRLIHSLGS